MNNIGEHSTGGTEARQSTGLYTTPQRSGPPHGANAQPQPQPQSGSGTEHSLQRALTDRTFRRLTHPGVTQGLHLWAEFRWVSLIMSRQPGLGNLVIINPKPQFRDS